MTISYVPADEVAKIKKRLGHPVIDNDGHIVEFIPLVRDIIVELAGPSVAARFDRVTDGGRTAQLVPTDKRREMGMTRSAWWGVPTRNTLDRATAMLPSLMYRRLDEMGIDFAFLYPTYGLTAIHLADDELRQVMSRAYNIYLAEVYGPYRDRMTPVACIPTFNPQEAIEELDYAVNTLGLRATMMGGAIPRPLPEHSGPGAKWMDGLGHASAYDYTPLWEKCVELGVAPTFHSTGAGWGSRTSPSNYCYNHIGNFAVAGELCARSLFFGGVPKKFPQLRFAFLEGGTAWAANLYSDILGHYEKRNIGAIDRYNPDELDRDLLRAFFEEHAEGRIRDRIAQLPNALNMLSEPILGDNGKDDFAESLITSPEDVRDVFTKQFFFGCEADDPMAAIAFNTRLNPLGARIPAIFASDIGHWDVPDFREVLHEAWELVEDGHLDESDFKAFTFDNPVALWAGANPSIFDGTVIEGALK